MVQEASISAKFDRISVVGLGYIGLPTATMFASRRYRVIGVDVNENTVETINRGDVHIVEPELDIAVRSAVMAGYLTATTVPEPADAFLIAVPTPVSGDDHNPNLAYIEAAANAIAPVLVSGNLVVLESTSPVGATERMAEQLSIARPDLTFPQSHGEKSDIRIAHCPERVLPGNVMQELVSNDRVIGGMTSLCSELASRLYRIFVTGDCVHASSPRAAEMVKLTENSFRDVNIAFANELSLICDRQDIDVWELISLANRHPRVNILQPGPGVGGHCIAVDPWFIVASAPKESKVIRLAREVNDGKPDWVFQKVQAEIAALINQQGNPLSEQATIACYGLSFKPNIDDLRESPALEITLQIANRLKCRLLIVEPYLEALPESLEESAVLTPFEVARQEANIHVMLVDHNEFRNSIPPKGRIIDTRGVWRERIT